MSVRAGVDTGGTFTDLVLFDEDTRRDPHVEGALDAERALARRLRLVREGRARHARTSRTSCTARPSRRTRSSSGKGADVALLTTDGFRDILRIQRVTRPNHFDLHWVKPRHFVPRVALRRRSGARAARRLGARPARRGSACARRSSACATAARSRRSRSPTSSRSSTPTHELRTRELIEELWPEVRVSLSHEVLPRWREYERTSTTVLDAYLKPLMHDYMARLEQECERRRHRPAARSCARTAA